MIPVESAGLEMHGYGTSPATCLPPEHYKGVFGMGMFLCIALLGLDLMLYFLGMNVAAMGSAVIAFLVPVIVMCSYSLIHIEKDPNPSSGH
ncbi:hypothetical protein A4S02_09615 [Acetobacter ascendens]|uniref:Uncharacterized protein n=2 Tax=Acetobacter ascendens TaxID=481146 RepID=A0A1D8QX98_9PROT|nr:hypothetical protein [Acetobacter ascendens]AOW46975.1 hypothetical protein A4S02_09615 [Acetobacter ascendens]AOW48251.1 hypothetical protein A4R89_01195 [Acetobacter ascendens]RCL05675.1 hypothetical protein BBA71_08810 [Acetobacter pasteurianus]